MAIGACGGDEAEEKDSGSSAAPAALKLGADPGGELKFDQTELKATAGTVMIDFDNPADVPHAVQIDGEGEASETVTKGKAQLSVDLEAGEYDFYCPVGQHRDKGMEGTLTVE